MMNTRVTLAAGFILGLVVVAFVFLSQLEKRYIFFPSSVIEQTPADLGVEYEEVFFTTGDGVRLHGWYLPGTGDVTWLWFHGNGGNISHRVDELAIFRNRLGVNQFIFDYRGYGRSPGTPSEQGTYQDSRAALVYLLSRTDVAPDKIVYFGRSLGAAIAVELATSREPMALVLVAPFASIADMAKVAFPFMPFHLFVRGRYDSVARIKGIHVPVLILHGDQDATVPLNQGRKLFEAANEPKRFQLLPGTAHNDTYIAGGGNYWDTVEEFLASLENGSKDSRPD
jgi:fermentation-respiration switch protein FrsA (DUF1100 family)